MTNPKLTKTKITEAVLKELPEKFRVELNQTTDNLLVKWWATGRQDGLRLTELGDMHFRTAEIEFYDFNLETDIKRNHAQEWHLFLLECNRKIKCPYYLGVNKTKDKKIPYIRFYDSKIAMLVELYGSLKDYLNSIKDKK